MASVLFLALETHFRKYNSSQWRCSVLCCSASAVARTPVLPSESSHSWGGHNCHLYSHILTSWNILRFFPTPLFMLLFTTLWQPSVLALVLVLFFWFVLSRVVVLVVFVVRFVDFFWGKDSSHPLLWAVTNSCTPWRSAVEYRKIHWINLLKKSAGCAASDCHPGGEAANFVQ